MAFLNQALLVACLLLVASESHLANALDALRSEPHSLGAAQRPLHSLGLLPSELAALAGEVSREGLEALLAHSDAAQPQKLNTDVEPRDGIPEGVECEETMWCDSAAVCSRVCVPGSVVVDPWLSWATGYQLALARKQLLCYAQMLGTHNSAITLANGYGNRDAVYSSYLRWLGTLGARTDLETNNHWVSLTDQLNMGVRALELDVHWVQDKLRIAHCGGFQSPALNHIVSLINAVAKLVGRTELVWDAESLGCSPSLSSLPTSEQRGFADALAEIAAWLTDPAHAQDFLFIDLDNQPDLAKWNKTGLLLEQILDAFPSGAVLTPPDARAMVEAAGAVPTLGQLVAAGKRLMVLSGTDYGALTESVLFSRAGMAALCPYTEAWMVNFRFLPDDGDVDVARHLPGEEGLSQQGGGGRGGSGSSSGSRAGEAAAAEAAEAGRPEAALTVSLNREEGGGNREGAAATAAWARVGSGAEEEEEGKEEVAAWARVTADAAAPAAGRPSLDAECSIYKAAHRDKAARRLPLASGGLVRMLGCELKYGPADCHFSFGRTPNAGFTMGEGDVMAAVACGVNFPSPDRLVPARAAAHVWAWAQGHPDPRPAAYGSEGARAGAAAAPGGGRVPRWPWCKWWWCPHVDPAPPLLCALLSAADGRWRVGPCDADAAGAAGTGAVGAGAGAGAGLGAAGAAGAGAGVGASGAVGAGAGAASAGAAPTACRLSSSPSSAAGTVASLWALAAAGSACPPGYAPDIPHTARENLALQQVASAEDARQVRLPLAPPTWAPAWLSGA